MSVGKTEEIDVPIDAIRLTDPNVSQKLPPETVIEGLREHGSSLWTRTARIDATKDGKPTHYFLKATSGDRGRKLVSAEYAAMSEIHKHMGPLVPRPLAWGEYRLLEGVHFFICEFRNMSEKIPEADAFASQIAEMHKKITNAEGKFGYDMTTYHGNVPIEHGWSDTWEEYFTRTTKALLDVQQETCGADEEILSLVPPFLEQVIPRLLRPLETGGRTLKPTLIHGDLWHGNIATDKDTDRPIIFDAASFYAHNEYELAVWRQPWNAVMTPFCEAYTKYFEISEPKEDFDDRIALYATRVNMLDSILYHGRDDTYLKMLRESMRALVQKFATEDLDG